MVGSHSSIEVTEQVKSFSAGDSRYCFIQCLIELLEQRVGAYTVMIFAGPEDIDRWSASILSVHDEGGSMKATSVFLTANPTPCCLGSSEDFPSQKKV